MVVEVEKSVRPFEELWAGLLWRRGGKKRDADAPLTRLENVTASAPPL
jgi:hypothetical protein